jgi:hypothetical protein
MAAVVRPRFYPYIAVAAALVVFAGFARTFYLRYWFDLPPMTLLTQLHGLVFSAWVALFVVQTRLIAANNVRAHMRLGIAGVVLAALVFAFGVATAVISASAPRMRPMAMASYQFVFIPLSIIVIYAGFVTAAVLLRKRPQLHKRFMVLAMIAVLPPATARLLHLAGGDMNFLALQTSVTAIFVIGCILYDRLKFRVVHPVYAYGGAFLILAWPFRAWFARTPAWEHIGRWMASL